MQSMRRQKDFQCMEVLWVSVFTTLFRVQGWFGAAPFANACWAWKSQALTYREPQKVGTWI